MSREEFSISVDHEPKEPLQVFSYLNVQFEPRRAFIHALHHKGYPLDFQEDTNEPGQMNVHTDTHSASKVTQLMGMYEQSTIYRLLGDVYEGYPESLEKYLRLIPIEQIHPQDEPYRQADFQHSVVENFFVRAYERNKDKLQEFGNHPPDSPRTLQDYIEYTYRTKLVVTQRATYDYARNRGVYGSTSNELPYILYPFIDQLTRANTQLLPRN